MTHRLHLAAVPFRLIKSGQKVVELRLYDEKRRNISIGDVILFVSPRSQEIKARVVGLLNYATFDDLLHAIGPDDLGCESIQEARAMIRRFYTPEDELKNTVLGIRFEML